MHVQAVPDDPLRQLIATETAVQAIVAEAHETADAIVAAAGEAAERHVAAFELELARGDRERAEAIEAELRATLDELAASTAAAVRRLQELPEEELNRLADCVLDEVLPRLQRESAPSRVTLPDIAGAKP